MADRLTQLQDAVNSVGRKYYVKIASINPMQGGGAKTPALHFFIKLL